MRLIESSLLAICLFITGAFVSAFATDATNAESSKHCLDLHRISSVKVLDKKNLAFEMVGGDYYVSQLPYACNALRRDRAIMYQASANKLCDVDSVKVMDNIGEQFRSIGSCGLGKFKAVSKEEMKIMKEKLALDKTVQ